MPIGFVLVHLVQKKLWRKKCMNSICWTFISKIWVFYVNVWIFLLICLRLTFHILHEHQKEKVVGLFIFIRQMIFFTEIPSNLDFDETKFLRVTTKQQQKFKKSFFVIKSSLFEFSLLVIDLASGVYIIHMPNRSMRVKWFD